MHQHKANANPTPHPDLRGPCTSSPLLLTQTHTSLASLRLLILIVPPPHSPSLSPVPVPVPLPLPLPVSAPVPVPSMAYPLQESKRPSSLRSSAAPPPSKRLCTSRPSSTPLDIESILSMPEDVIWTLRKQDLRNCFLTLQHYALHPYPFASSLPSPTTTPFTPSEASLPANFPPLLRLPLEIRELIYGHLLPPPCNPPIRGPHPRQLQSHIHLSQPVPSALLLVNHQIRSEALPIFYGAPTQEAFINVDFNLWKHKTRRSDLILSSEVTSSLKHIHLSLHLGSEKKNNRPGDIEADARITEVKKGIKKMGKWLAGAELQSLKISWQEPPQTYTWEQKKVVLDGLRGLRALKVDAGEINWGLNWNKGRKYRFEIEYLKELERGRQDNSVTS